MILHLHDVAPQAGLRRCPTSPSARFLNLLIRLVAAIYPTFTYGDNPPQWTTEGAPPTCAASACTRAAPNVAGGAAGRRAAHAGERFSALDLYVAVMTRWRPGPAWFESVCPALTAVAREADAIRPARALRSQLPFRHRIARLSACGAASERASRKAM